MVHQHQFRLLAAICLLLTLLSGIGLQLVVAQEPTETPIVTPLQRPTLQSTGLPIPIQQNPFASDTPTRTRTPSRTPSASPSPSATITPTPSITRSLTPTQTPSRTASPTPTNTKPPTADDIQIDAVEDASPTASTTPTRTPTRTPLPTETASPSPTITATETATETQTPTETATATVSPTATETPIPINITSDAGDNDASGEQSPLIFVLGGLVLIGLAGYATLYAVSGAALDRYAGGFVIYRCPVCEEGALSVEERNYRSFGIPRTRRTVRCDNCRSVLREVGRRRWRYAVDPNANPELFEQLNNDILAESDLHALTPQDDAAQPSFYDTDDFPTNR